MENDAKYAIITSVKNFYTPFDWVRYFVTNFISFVKYHIYIYINKTKAHKYKQRLFDTVRYETINGKQYPIIGHPQLELSIIKGFLDLQIPFKMNEFAENSILLWVDKIDLTVLERLERQGKFKKAATVPTACKYDYNDLMWNFPKYDCIDVSLVASEWIKEKNQSKLDEKFHKKIVSWASGVDLPEITAHKPYKSCIYYNKRKEPNKELIDFIEQKGIHCEVVVYGDYAFNDWLKLLQKNDFVIFNQNNRETQGLAMAEAWSYNLPALCSLYKGNCVSPYLTAQTGLCWEHEEQLKEIILQYCANPDAFLSQFSPREYVEKNMTNAKSVSDLIQIFNEITC